LFNDKEFIEDIKKKYGNAGAKEIFSNGLMLKKY